MSRKTIPADASIDRWREDSEFRAAYEALDEEFAIASRIIEARARAGLTPGRTGEANAHKPKQHRQAESGRSKPSVTTLEKLAVATNSRLRLTLGPA